MSGRTGTMRFGAFLMLFLNGIVPEDAVPDARTLPRVRMPNRDGFVPLYR